MADTNTLCRPGDHSFSESIAESRSVASAVAVGRVKVTASAAVGSAGTRILADVPWDEVVKQIARQLNSFQSSAVSDKGMEVSLGSQTKTFTELITKAVTDVKRAFLENPSITLGSDAGAQPAGWTFGLHKFKTPEGDNGVGAIFNQVIEVGVVRDEAKTVACAFDCNRHEVQKPCVHTNVL